MSAPAPLKETDRPAASTGPEATGPEVYSRAGDEIVVRGTTAGVIARDGAIVGLRHPHGSPPCDPRRTDNGRVALCFPGSDAYVRHLSPAPLHPEPTCIPDELTTGGGHAPAR
ncbi:DUF1918 domain-containing protein [Streptomyces sp. IMTB 2501]|uniref:DUF1918 domain-containing protein n=1 Tax=Streptomyces sp. IMTB 2501 TaxID=1776340 RepID=UPI0009A2173B|nr:DUF1918 domain-containing protein [Streptomyces sp. IMTB 2501]